MRGNYSCCLRQTWDVSIMATRSDEQSETYMVNSSKQVNHFLFVSWHELDRVENLLFLAVSQHGQLVDIVAQILVNEGLKLIDIIRIVSGALTFVY